jgi:predicted DNA-binding transcriptional regulator AlpA
MRTPKLRSVEAAEYLRLSPSTLAKMRVSGRGPAYEKAGDRIVLYDLAELDNWLKQRRHRSTSEQAPR